MNAVVNPAPMPLWMVAELTYRCPLHCAFCSNPVDFAKVESELSTEEWFRVFAEARALGAVQLGLTGGEPLSRPDLELLVAEAHRLGFYTNLITSGVGLNEPRMRALKDAGLDHVQLSFQDSTRELNDFLSSTRTFALKRRVATLIKDHGFPMVMNCVIHRLNIDHVDRIIDLAASPMLEATWRLLARGVLVFLMREHGATSASLSLWIAKHEQLLAVLESDSSAVLDEHIEYHIFSDVRARRPPVETVALANPGIV